MSARRMAAEQPESYAFSAAAEKEINMWVKKYPKDRQRSALIPALWIAQKDAGGWLPEVAMRAVADKLGMAYIRVYEVVTFYTMFNMAPVGEHFIQLCGTTPCWLRGSDDLIAVMKRRVGAQNTISTDGKLSWLEVECLGACANAPMVQISNAAGDSYYEDLTAESFDALLDKLVAGEAPDYGPQNSRHTSEPEGGAQALITDAIFDQELKLKALPNADKKAAVTYHAADPKGRRATVAGRKRKPKGETAPMAARPPRSAPVKPKPNAKAKPKSARKSQPKVLYKDCLLYTSPSPRDLSTSRMPSSA